MVVAGERATPYHECVSRVGFFVGQLAAILAELQFESHRTGIITWNRHVHRPQVVAKIRTINPRTNVDALRDIGFRLWSPLMLLRVPNVGSL
jgi:hypothetical protein